MIDRLHRLSVHIREPSAKNVVASYQRIHTALECGHVQSATQAQRFANDVGGVPRMKLLGEPKTLLRERDRYRVWPYFAREPQICAIRAGTRGVDGSGQPRQGRFFENRVQG